MANSYSLPQALVFQEFRETPAEITDPLRAWICGPNAQLHRYSEPTEKADISLGAYNPAVNTAYNWPDRSTGGLVDQDYVKLFIDDALLQYFHDPLSDGSFIAPVESYANRIRAASNSVGFKTNTATYPRASALLDRDVRIGDTVYIRGVVDGDTHELWSYVAGFVNEQVAAEIGEVSADAANAVTAGSNVTVTQTAGATNCLALAANISAYDGRADGSVTETYTLLVTQGSVDGDLTTAELQVTTASGLDDVAVFVPAAAGVAKAIGTRGMTVTWGVDGEGSSCSSEQPGTAQELIAGQQFRIVVRQAFESGRCQAGGTYTGATDDTYVIEVTRGGKFNATTNAGKPQITVTTTHGRDYSGPTLVPSDSADVVVGSKGLTVQFFGSGDGSSISSSSGVSQGVVALDDLGGLRKGDKWYVPVTAVSNGRVSTLVLAHNLSADLREATDLELKLFIKRDLQITKNRIEAPPAVNWSTGATQISVKSGITAYDASWTDDGVEQALPVKGGTLYAEYREWLPGLGGNVFAVASDADLAAVPGPTHPDNPLKAALAKAWANSNGTVVRYSAVPNPALLASWTAQLEEIEGQTDLYTLVPLTRQADVLAAFASHVASQSSADKGAWRGCMFNLAAAAEAVVVSATTSSDDETVMATLGDDPDSEGTQYTLLRITSDNADLADLGVVAGDEVRFLYVTDGFGTTTYTSFTVDTVINETELRLVTGHSGAISVAQKVEIWHPRTKTEIATALGASAAAFASRRVCAIWPDVVYSGGVAYEGYHLCAALAGLISGVSPHQGLTNVAVAGFDDLTRTTEYFNATQLNTMAGSGVWIVTRNRDGVVITRHALTTDMTDLNSQEEMIRRNVDSMSFVFLHRLAPFIGRANVTPTSLAQMRIQLVGAIDYLRNSGFTERLGGQLIDAAIIELRQHALLKDRVVVVIELEIPAPVNRIECYLVI